MNHPDQLRNLLEFTALFLSGDLKLHYQSTDYIKEKYDKYIGFPIKHNGDTTNLYLEWTKIWGENKDINSIFLYLVNLSKIYRDKKIQKVENHWLLDVTADELLDTFEKYIGSTDNMNLKRYKHIHPLVQEVIIIEYVKKYDRLFKLLRILKENF